MNTAISVTNLEDFNAIRGRLMAAIGRTVEHGHRGKIYEGTFEISMPSYFQERKIDTFSLLREEDSDAQWKIRLSSYLIGPGRHYEWTGPTFDVAIAAATKDIDEWITEIDEFIAEEKLSMTPTTNRV